MSEVVAWGVEINSMECIVFATTAPKARYIAVRGYWEAGYGSRRVWPRAIAWREQRYDRSSLRERKPSLCYCRDYVESIS